MFKLIDAERRSMSQSARRVGVHVSTMWRWCLKGVNGRKLPSVRVGGRRYVLADDLEQFIAAGRDAGDDDPGVDPDRASRAEAELAARGI